MLRDSVGRNARRRRRPASRAQHRRPARASSSRVTVSSSAMPTRVSLMRRRLKPCRQRRLHQRIGVRRLDHDRVEERVVHAGDGRRAAPHRPAAAPADSPAGRCASAPPARATPRSSPAITASSTCAVQMLDVAFSRRMCCSRVCNASRIAGCPAASSDTPTSRPGMCRLNASRVAKNAGVRAAEAHRHAEALRRTDHHVGAHLARRRQQRQRQRIGARRSPARPLHAPR